MELLFKGKALGRISEAAFDDPFWWGTFTPNVAFTKEMEEGFSIATDPSRAGEINPQDPFWDEANWEVADGANRRNISLPAIYTDATISWRDR